MAEVAAMYARMHLKTPTEMPHEPQGRYWRGGRSYSCQETIFTKTRKNQALRTQLTQLGRVGGLRLFTDATKKHAQA